MRIFSWLLRAVIFFTLFAFALNNQHNATVHWFFGFEWTAPLVFVVLAAFAAGCAIGVLAMAPGRWRWRPPAAAPAGPAVVKSTADSATAAPSDFAPEHPPREGL
jgi:lipopolysaccharide assembly protein A